MSNPYRALVNQRLYFARLHLEWLQAMLAAQAVPATVAEQAAGESLTWHLVLAYRSYLRELAAAYQLPSAVPQTAVELGQLLRAQQRESAECQEWIGLERSSSWLAGLLVQFERIGKDTESANGGSTKAKDQGSAAPMQVIPAQHLDSGHMSAQQLQHACQSLQEIIARQRNHLEEW